jgi:hypothetical protein
VDDTVGAAASVKLEVWLSETACVPSTLSVLAAPETVAFKLDVTAPESGWSKGRWQSLTLPTVTRVV